MTKEQENLYNRLQQLSKEQETEGDKRRTEGDHIASAISQGMAIAYDSAAFLVKHESDIAEMTECWNESREKNIMRGLDIQKEKEANNE